MYARTLFIAAQLAGLAIACSKPATDRAGQNAGDQTARAAQELALTVPANPAVASEIEVARPGQSRQTSAPRRQVAARERTPAVVANVPTELPAVSRDLGEASVTEPVIAVAADEPLAAPPRSGPSASEPSGPNVGGGRTWPEPIGRQPGIIIRGGRGGGSIDPCDLHGPMGGRGSVPTVLINPRVPTRGLPAAPRGGGGLPF